MTKLGFKEKSLCFLLKTKDKFVEVTQGKANFNSMIYLWGLIPGLIITIFFQRRIDLIKNSILLFLVYVIIATYFTWHIFCIRKTLKVQPQYRVVKPSKKELYKDKTKEEIEKMKKEKRKENIQKLLLLKAWDSAPNYVLIGCFDAYLALTQIQGIFRIFKY